MDARKPLGRKAYGSIPHLPGSRLGPGDHRCHNGQARICTQQARDRHDRVIVTEKLDGSNCSVALARGEILALGRAGYLAQSSRFEQHQVFAAWVRANEDRFRGVLREGERLVGEWLAQAHGTRYELPHEPYVVFDLMRGGQRAPWNELVDRANVEFVLPRLVSDAGPLSIENACTRVQTSGHGALDPVEGAVWRVERRGAFDFLAKFVHPWKVDGRYLPEVSGAAAVWNWRPQRA